MFGISAVPAPFIATLMGADALAAMEYFDRAGGDSHIDFDADEGVRNGIQELVNLDVIVETDACVQPFGELPIGGRQRIEGVALDLLEQLAATDAEFAHGTLGAVAYIAKAGTLARRVLTEGAWPYRMPVRVRGVELRC